MFAAEGIDRTGHDAPGGAEAGIKIKANDLDGFLGAGGELPIDEADGLIGGLYDSGDGECLEATLFGGEPYRGGGFSRRDGS